VDGGAGCVVVCVGGGAAVEGVNSEAEADGFHSPADGFIIVVLFCCV